MRISVLAGRGRPSPRRPCGSTSDRHPIDIRAIDRALIALVSEPVQPPGRTVAPIHRDRLPVMRALLMTLFVTGTSTAWSP